MNGKNLGWLRAAVVASLLVGTSAHAQWDPESGDTGQWTPPPAEQPPAQQPPQQQQQQQPPQQQQQQQPPAQQPPANGWQQAPAQQPQQQQPQQQQGWFNGQNGERPPGQGGPADTEAPGQAAPAGTTDHSQVSFGVTFFGLDSLTLLAESDDNDAIRLRMPAIGIRYWVSESIGLDIGIGLGIVGEKQFNNCPIVAGNCGAEERTGGIDGGFGIRLHFGLPVALKTYEHFNVLLTPEIGFQYGQATIFDPRSLAPVEAEDALDIGISSIALDVGVKIGEIGRASCRERV